MASSSEERKRNSVAGDKVLFSGSTVDNYLIKGLHATAGYSCVYEATNTSTGHSVAIKVLHERLALSPRHVERFHREYEALHLIRHPNIVEIFGYGLLDDGRPYFAMEWCEGPTLDTLLLNGGFTVEEAMPILRQLIEAVQAVHDVDVVHRDIKPSNIILIPSAGEAPLLKLIDFGIAIDSDFSEIKRTSLTSTGACLGTPYSMAPEQIYGAPLDERTDVYALGVLIYELLTGQKPFFGAAIAEVVDKHLSVPPPRLSDLIPVTASLDRVIQRCMAKASEDRFETAISVLDALEAAVNDQSQDEPGIEEAIGMHVDIDFRCSEDEVEDADLDLVDELLCFAQEACAAAGLRVALETGNGFLAVGLLPRHQLQHRALRLAVIDFAHSITERYQGEKMTSISLSIVLHVGAVKAEFCDGVTSFVGGPLLSVAEWSAVEDEAPLIATKYVLRGLEVQHEQVADRPGYVRLK